MFYIIIILLTIVNEVKCYQTIKINKPRQTVIECTSDYKIKSCLWKNPTNDLFPSHSFNPGEKLYNETLKYNNRNIKLNLKKHICTIRIEEVTRANIGVWRCDLAVILCNKCVSETGNIRTEVQYFEIVYSAKLQAEKVK